MTPSAPDQVRQSPIEAHHFERLQNAGPFRSCEPALVVKEAVLAAVWGPPALLSANTGQIPTYVEHVVGQWSVPEPRVRYAAFRPDS